MQRSLPSIKRFGARIVSRALDVLAIVAIGFILWKVLIAPRNLDPARAYPAPHAAYARLDGSTFRVSDGRGRVLFLDFFASWCEPCKIELPLIERWAQTNPRALVVPIDVGEPQSVAKAFAQKYDLHGVALDPHQSAGAFFDVHGFPTVVVVDPAGRIRAKWEGLNPAIELAMSNALSGLDAQVDHPQARSGH
ncbi:MAG TPA: TlpA disulfide reductase family protein [Candidatus Baltobacteraceae bacterium]|nr:TlpA disulfide reductase family protein [Candidatus Baltobacteraceae bacterium]